MSTPKHRNEGSLNHGSTAEFIHQLLQSDRPDRLAEVLRSAGQEQLEFLERRLRLGLNRVKAELASRKISDPRP